jgi:dissimilatory sulfite reductase (desulfoviridin) alpha/beta subunit
VGGRWGRTKQVGLRIARFLTEADAVQIVGRIKKWYCENGDRGERLGAVILRKGVGTLQETVLQKIKTDKWVNITAESQSAFQIIR